MDEWCRANDAWSADERGDGDEGKGKGKGAQARDGRKTRQPAFCVAFVPPSRICQDVICAKRVMADTNGMRVEFMFSHIY